MACPRTKVKNSMKSSFDVLQNNFFSIFGGFVLEKTCEAGTLSLFTFT